MLCPHVFRNLASISELNIEPPPAPLLSAFPGLVCELAPPVKFGWQVSPPAAQIYSRSSPTFAAATSPQERK
jgi:hypothetical protein